MKRALFLPVCFYLVFKAKVRCRNKSNFLPF
ncbi:hypothetical protein DET1022 [Dehalococcoides mccartyi 195]|uniref:Uncharacterized protein n=1 Tax=Dehalococcoides mccartyi (strain ATCC BAA-2266 / KCTC 15142 / 195) TaxID=243164 RepID=Q3Z7Q9_DEHM1|nr:hypothetical protein DET1022 [Dehalococcoides mccartyi 195]